MKRLIQQAKARWDLQRLVANVYAENIGSVKVLERCGFINENGPRLKSDVDDYRFILRL